MTLASRISRALIGFMLLVVWTIWAPIGFLLWIPLLVRTTILFAAFVVHAAVTGQDPSHLRQHLELAVDFWFVGFRMAKKTVLATSTPSAATFEVRTDRVVLEVAWAAVFWVAAIWLAKPDIVLNVVRFVPVPRQEPAVFVWIALVLMVIAFIIGWAVGSTRKENDGAPTN